MTIKIAPLAVAISLATTVQAAPVTELEKVVVSASRSQASISNISGTVQVISQDDIVQQSQPGQKLAGCIGKTGARLWPEHANGDRSYAKCAWSPGIDSD